MVLPYPEQNFEYNAFRLHATRTQVLDHNSKGYEGGKLEMILKLILMVRMADDATKIERVCPYPYDLHM
jgi:hypothetical protein